MSAVNFLFYLCVLIYWHLHRKKQSLLPDVSFVPWDAIIAMFLLWTQMFQQNCTSGAILQKDFLQHVRIQYELCSNLTEVIIYGIEGTESWPSSEFLFSSSLCTCRKKRYHWKHYGTICTLRYMCVQKWVFLKKDVTTIWWMKDQPSRKPSFTACRWTRTLKNNHWVLERLKAQLNSTKKQNPRAPWVPFEIKIWFLVFGFLT